MMRWLPTLVCGAAVALAACGEPTEPAAPAKEAGSGEAPPPPTNRIDVPSAVRRNLGITFARVQTRDVRNTIRVPGSFEILRDAHSAYSSALPGHVELLVKQHQHVEANEPLFRIRSPKWRELQAELASVVASLRRATARVESLGLRQNAAAEHVARLGDEQQIWKERLRQIEELRRAGGGVASAQIEAKSRLGELSSSIAEASKTVAGIKAERKTIEAEIASYRETSPVLYAEVVGSEAEGVEDAAADLRIARAAALLGVPPKELHKRWRTIEYVEVRARQHGHVESLGVTNGAWVEAGAMVLETVDPSQLRFRAVALQADLPRLANGMPARVLPPGGTGEGLAGSVFISLHADPATRQIDLLIGLKDGQAQPHWARQGVSSEVELFVASTNGTLAVPNRSVILDGLNKVIFRRDPKDPNKVIRLNADLGLSDGRWVAVESGLMEGDEVVLDGVYELMLASGTDQKLKGGHFHADGTWHADDH